MNENLNPEALSAPRPCPKCKGEGHTHSEWRVENGYEGPEGQVCHRCKGKGSFPGLSVKAIVDALFTTKGKARVFRKAFPSKLNHYGTLDGARAYYVWRLARFHGGADVTMPMTADMVIGSDPFRAELDLMSEMIARRVFGSDMAGAYRWNGLLGGGLGETPKGLPPSAYESGPVADEFKPAWEVMELR
jgi:hypothetical protein